MEPRKAAKNATNPEDTRARILAVTAGLIASGGREAATTRAIAAAADVQAPTIYRLFGDKNGLLDAVAEHVLANYYAEKSQRQPHPDPVRDLREGWDMHVAFSLANPELFSIMSADPHPTSAGQAEAYEVLRRRVRAIAAAGRLRVSEERAIALLQAMGAGTVLTLLGQPEGARDDGFSAFARESVVATLTGEARASQDSDARSTAAALRASLESTAVLSAGERHLLEELLTRIANGG